MNRKRTKRILIILINTLLVLVIAAIIIATWMPAIYTSDWFHHRFPKW
jgi:flagellar basal body-associated protein FliL